MRFRERPRADDIEPRRTALHDWANAWTKEVADAVGGLRVHEWHRIRTILHEIRVRAAAGDESHPEADQVPAQPDLIENT